MPEWRGFGRMGPEGNCAFWREKQKRDGGGNDRKKSIISRFETRESWAEREWKAIFWEQIHKSLKGLVARRGLFVTLKNTRWGFSHCWQFSFKIEECCNLLCATKEFLDWFLFEDMKILKKSSNFWTIIVYCFFPEKLLNRCNKSIIFQCNDCQRVLDETCTVFLRHGRTYCKEDYSR